MRRTVLATILATGTGCPAWFEQAPEPTIHTVERGDSLWGIAKAHGVSVDQIKAWNGLEGDTIEVGQELELYLEGGGEAVVAKGPGASKRGSARRSSGGGAAGTSTVAASPTAGLHMPPEKSCLSGPSLEADDGEEASFAASKGLAYTEVRAGMRAIVDKTMRCVPEGTQPAGTMELRLTVACTGRVARVQVLDDGGLPPDS